MKTSVLFILISFSALAQFSNRGGLCQPAVIFEGNSLFTTESFTTSGTPYYIPEQCRSYLESQGHIFAYHVFAVSGRSQTAINNLMSRFNSKSVNCKTVVVIWEGTNEIDVAPALTGQNLYDTLMRFVNHVKQYTDKYLILTCIARDLVTDEANMWGKLQTYDSLIRVNHAPEHVVSLDLLPYFDSKADCSDTNYYKDKLHLMKRGQDSVNVYLKPKVEYLLNH